MEYSSQKNTNILTLSITLRSGTPPIDLTPLPANNLPLFTGDSSSLRQRPPVHHRPHASLVPLPLGSGEEDRRFFYRRRGSTPRLMLTRPLPLAGAL